MKSLRRKTTITSLFIRSAKNQPAKLCPCDGTGTHHAWFHCHIESTVGEVLASQRSCCGSDGLHLRMCRDIREALCQVVSTGDNLTA